MDIDQSTLLWIIRIIVWVLAFALGFSVWSYMRRERLVPVPKKPAYQPPENTDAPEKVITLSLMAKPGYFFDNEKLFDVIQKAGFVYTERQTFEYMVEGTEYVAFSLIHIRPPYTFALDEKNSRINTGICAAMKLPVADGDQQSHYFHLMLSVLEELGVQLDAQLCDSRNTPMKNKKLYEIQQEIELFEHTYAQSIRND